MKAIQIQSYGGPEVLGVAEVALPQPGAGEVLIKVATVGVNYADLQLRQGLYMMPGGLPAILGFEVAGTVVALGEGVTEPAIGARVVAGRDSGGGYAEYACMPAATAIPLAPEVDFATATALYVQGLTAYGLLRSAARLQEGESVLIHAAAGGVGSLAVQLARLLGANKVVGMASTPEKLELVHQLGVDAAINYAEPDWVDKVLAATQRRGVDIVLDGVGSEISAYSLNAMSQGGRMIIYGMANAQPAMISTQTLLDKTLSIRSYAMATQTAPEQMVENMRELLHYLVEGQLRVIIGQTYPLSEAAAAHQAIIERRTVGKVVLVV